MNRYITLLGIVLAVLAAVFQLVSLLPSAVLFLVIAAIILIGIGSITGQ